MTHPRGAAEARPARSGDLHEWYLTEASRGQRLLEGGQPARAAEVFQAILVRLGDVPSYERAAVLERLGLCLHLGGRPDLAAARLREAMSITEALAPSKGGKSLHGTLHSDLGDVLRATGEFGDARKSYQAALDIARELNDLRSQGVVLAHLGGLALVEGELQEARAHYETSLQLVQRLHEPALEAVARHQLGRVLQGLRQWDEAERHYLKAAGIREKHGNLTGAAQTWSQLASLSEEAGAPETAEPWYRKAIDADRKVKAPAQLGRHLSDLARLLLRQPSRLDEARDLAEEALTVAQAPDPAAPDVWRIYGILADILDLEAADNADGQRRASLETRACRYRHLQRQAPRIVVALARLGDPPGYARAAILERLARCFHMGGRPDLAVTHLRDAVLITEALTSREEVKRLRGMLHSALGDVLSACGQRGEARQAYGEALKIAEDLEDLRGQSRNLGQLGGLALADGRLEEAQTRYETALPLLRRLREPALEAVVWRQLGTVLKEMRQWDEAERHVREAARLVEESAPAAGDSRSSGFQVTLCEEVHTDHVFEPDLLLDGPHERRIVRWTGEPDPLADEACPVLVPGARTCMDDDGAVRFCLPLGEPILERHPGCIVMRRIRREVTVSGHAGVLWNLIRRMDGARTVAEVLSALPTGDREAGARLLGVLAATEVIDVSGRPIGRFLHAATKKGVLPGGGLKKDEILRLAMDGGHRAYPGAPRLAVSHQVPERVRAFHALTRVRRSYREYLGRTVDRADFDALLHTACGVTGEMVRAGREVKLRAYPSSGALYAVEIYPVVFGVAGLEPAVYHYRAVENVLEVVRPDLDRARLLGAVLPVEREMVSGAAAMICLAGFFPRHERKYGQGGYRMMVAEAGHISQNLILAATALGLSARPFGGVFDALLNQDLGLDEAEEQFLLAVLIGRPAGGYGSP